MTRPQPPYDDAVIVVRGGTRGQPLARIGPADRSRLRVREALRLLELEGALTIRPGPGGGPMVASPTSDHLAGAFALILVVRESIVIVYVVNVFVSTVTTFFGPAEAATIPHLVPRQQLLAANGLFTLTLNAAFALGFALLLGTVAAGYATLRIARLSPAEAIRRGS